MSEGWLEWNFERKAEAASCRTSRAVETNLASILSVIGNQRQLWTESRDLIYIWRRSLRLHRKSKDQRGGDCHSLSRRGQWLGLELCSGGVKNCHSKGKDKT